jgi:hypothetical protein
MLKRSVNQLACIRIIHVVESASTPLAMTGRSALRLQICHKERRFPNRRGDFEIALPLEEQKCNQRDSGPVISYRSAKSAQQNNKH